jgi:hypothetical protein
MVSAGCHGEVSSGVVPGRRVGGFTVLGRTARQLQADPVAIVFAARDTQTFTGTGIGVGSFNPDGLPVLRLGGLDGGAARRLLVERAGEALPGEVSDRLVRETGGNPLALLELPTGLTAGQLQGTVPLPSQLPLTAGLERAFLDQCRRLPEQVQTLLLVTAADDTGRVATLRQAAGNCGVQARAWVEAEQSSLLSVEGDVVAVKHPLVRSAVYQAATSLERRQAHQALAEALSDDPDRATWHRAAAADGPDEGIVEALGPAGARAEQRGGYVAAAAAYERAAELTIDEAARAACLFVAARNAWASGQAIRARALAMTLTNDTTGDGVRFLPGQGRHTWPRRVRRHGIGDSLHRRPTRPGVRAGVDAGRDGPAPGGAALVRSGRPACPRSGEVRARW